MLDKYKKLFFGHKSLVTFSSIFLALIFIGIIYPFLPLTDDEAWNYLAFARFGQLHTITHYELPNNHVFFTFLETFLLHRKILSVFPLEMRFLNAFICTIFVGYVCYIFTKFFPKKTTIWIIVFLALAILFASPLSTPYFIVARGYMLGSLLLLVGTYSLNRKKYYSASLFFILSVWTIPTFIFAVPLQYLVAWYYERRDIKPIFLSAISVPIGSLILYLPILEQLKEAANSKWGIATLHEFSVKTFSSISNLYYLRFGSFLNVVYFAILVFSIYILIEKAPKDLKEFTMQLVSSCIGYIVIALIFFSFGHTYLPFVRNGLFIPLFSVVLIAAAVLVSSGRSKIILLAVLSLNVFAGVYLMTKLLPFNKHEYPVFAGEQNYTSKTLMHFLRNRNEGFIVNDHKDAVIIDYYSFIYSVPINEEPEK